MVLVPILILIVLAEGQGKRDRVVDSDQRGRRTDEDVKIDESMGEVSSARSRDFKHLDGWARKFQKQDWEHFRNRKNQMRD